MQKIFLIWFLLSSPAFAKESEGPWYLSHSALGGKMQKVILGEKQYGFINALGQNCRITAVKRQPNPEGPSAEERALVCDIDSKNAVATTFACWPPFEDLKQRSFVTSKSTDLKKNPVATREAVMILSCRKH